MQNGVCKSQNRNGIAASLLALAAARCFPCHALRSFSLSSSLYTTLAADKEIRARIEHSPATDAIKFQQPANERSFAQRKRGDSWGCAFMHELPRCGGGYTDQKEPGVHSKSIEQNEMAAGEIFPFDSPAFSQ